MTISTSSPGGYSPDQFLCTKQTARGMGISHRTLEDWRLKGGGPTFRKIGRAVRYLWGDVLDFMDSCARTNTGNPPA
jgi:hypothetical protein